MPTLNWIDIPEEKEKRDTGELWEKRSKGTCLFVMPTDKEYDVIMVKIG